jgi:glycosyltransferase involved in cell wall biosynthesis
MKIVLIGNEYKQQFPLRGYGGIESCVEQLAQGLSQAGVDFYVVVPKRQKSWWHRLPRYPFEVVEVDFMPGAVSGRPPAEFMAKVRELLETRPRPDVIWSQSKWAPPPLLDLSIPIITTLHDSMAERQPELMMDHPNVYYRFISNSQLQLQVQEEWEQRRSVRIYTGLSPEEYAFAAAPGDYYLWVAGLNWGWSLKGLDLFVELAERNPDKSFCCYGSGDLALARKLKKISAKMKNFRFGGELKRGRQHRRVFQRARALLMLSRTREAFGRTILESLSKGTPVIGRETGAIPEIIGPAGYCSNDVDQLNQALRQDFSRQACFEHAQSFSVATEVTQMMHYSQQILAGKV